MGKIQMGQYKNTKMTSLIRSSKAQFRKERSWKNRKKTDFYRQEIMAGNCLRATHDWKPLTHTMHTNVRFLGFNALKPLGLWRLSEEVHAYCWSQCLFHGLSSSVSSFNPRKPFSFLPALSSAPQLCDTCVCAHVCVCVCVCVCVGVCACVCLCIWLF